MTEGWDAVAKAIDGRLRQLPLTVGALAKRAELGPSSIRELRYNVVERKRNPSTLKRLSIALEWPPDHLEKVLRGDAVGGGSTETPATNSSLERRLDEIESSLLDALAAVRDLRARGDRDVDR